LICYPKWHLGAIGSAFFGGWAATILIIPRLADRYGRKWVFINSLIVTMVIMLLLIYVSTNINETIVYMFIAGGASSGRTTTGFVYCSEFLAPRWRIWFGTTFLCTTALTGFFLCIYFQYISKHYMYCASIGIISTTIGFILTAIYVEESPLWQLKKGRVAEAQVTLRKMMYYNNVEDADADIDALADIIKDDSQDVQMRL
jgi:MFS family permease